MGFYNSIDNTSNFVISFTASPRQDFGVFAKGYFQAASAVAQGLLAKQRFPDYEAYPVVFLYRQSLELYLKGLLYRAAILSAFKDIEGIDSCLHNRHRLIPLAQSAGRVCQALFPADQSLLHIVNKAGRIASEFEEIDSDSYSYRYPIHRQGNASTKHHQLVNLLALHETMRDLLRELDTVDLGLSIETSKAQEIHEVLQEVQSVLSEVE